MIQKKNVNEKQLNLSIKHYAKIKINKPNILSMNNYYNLYILLQNNAMDREDKELIFCDEENDKMREKSRNIFLFSPA